MGKDRFYLVVMLFLILALGYLTYGILSPFLAAIAWAAVFSIVFYPIYAFLGKYLRVKSIASGLTLILILLVIIGPVTFLTVQLVNELKGFVSHLGQDGQASIRDVLDHPRLNAALETARSYAGYDILPSREVMIENLRKAGTGLIDQLTLRITNVISVAIDFVFMVFTIFFMLKDGPGLLIRIKGYLPFEEMQKEKIAVQIKDMVVSTVYGGVIVAVIQGVLGGLAFAVVGIGSPVLWGSVMAVMSFVPLLGTFSIWGPAGFYLFIGGNVGYGIGLFLYGIFVISMVDNVLKPLIIGSRTKMHTIIIFFSVLGGIKLFGLIGLIMGPLIVAIFVSVFEIFRSIEGGSHAQS